MSLSLDSQPTVDRPRDIILFPRRGYSKHSCWRQGPAGALPSWQRRPPCLFTRHPTNSVLDSKHAQRPRRSSWSASVPFGGKSCCKLPITSHNGLSMTMTGKHINHDAMRCYEPVSVRSLARAVFATIDCRGWSWTTSVCIFIICSVPVCIRLVWRVKDAVLGCGSGTLCKADISVIGGWTGLE